MHRILVTGGAGFIGSNLVESLLKREDVALVRMLDDLSTGYWENVQEFLDHPKYEFLEGSITDYSTVEKALKDITRVSHQAAMGSVPRSIENPIRTNNVNVNGTLNVLNASKNFGIDRVVLAFSSSTYGDSAELPKVEEHIQKEI
jgi:UDP-N-acetylglucosamine 4-epimerase